MTLPDLLASLRARISRASTERELARVERAASAIRVAGSPLFLLSALSPDIRARRMALRLERRRAS
jgi:hypothetical protein